MLNKVGQAGFNYDSALPDVLSYAFIEGGIRNILVAIYVQNDSLILQKRLLQNNKISFKVSIFRNIGAAFPSLKILSFSLSCNTLVFYPYKQPCK